MGSSPRQYCSNLAWPTTFEDLRNVTVGEHLAYRYECHDCIDGLLVFLASVLHAYTLSLPCHSRLTYCYIRSWPFPWPMHFWASLREVSEVAATVGAMNSWHENPRAAFDLETTGRNPLTARIVTASIILVDARGAVLEHHEWLANPGVPIPVEAAAIHGVDTAMAVAKGLPSAQVTAGVAGVLDDYFRTGVPVLAFNARYDFTVLACEGLRHGLPIPEPRPVLDPYVMDKHADRYRPGKRTLTAMSSHYGVELQNAHTSAADVMATLGIASVLADRFPHLRRPAEHLHESQVTWALRQAASFQDYLRRTDPAAVVEGRWPAVAS